MGRRGTVRGRGLPGRRCRAPRVPADVERAKSLGHRPRSAVGPHPPRSSKLRGDDGRLEKMGKTFRVCDGIVRHVHAIGPSCDRRPSTGHASRTGATWRACLRGNVPSGEGGALLGHERPLWIQIRSRNEEPDPGPGGSLCHTRDFRTLFHGPLVDGGNCGRSSDP